MCYAASGSPQGYQAVNILISEDRRERRRRRTGSYCFGVANDRGQESAPASRAERAAAGQDEPHCPLSAGRHPPSSCWADCSKMGSTERCDEKAPPRGGAKLARYYLEELAA